MTSANSVDGSHIDLPRTVADIVRRQATERPDAPALTFGPATLTYGQLHERSSQAANALAALGVGRGHRVAVLAPNSPLFFELAFGLSKLGAVLVGLNWRLAAPELDVILIDAAPSVTIVADELAGMLTSAARAASKMVLSVDDFGAALASSEQTDPGAGLAPIDRPGPDDVVFMLYTSGTTGAPKGAQLTNQNMAHSAWISGGPYGFTAASTNLVAMPLFHVGGMGYGLSAFFHGGHTVLRVDADPAGLVADLAAHDHDPDGPRAGLLRSCGRPLPWVELRLVDPSSIASGQPADVEAGEVGEIWTRSAQNTPGYRKKPEETAAAITGDGWLRTGDAAYADDEGYLFLFDRFKDMIVSGAENVYPAEVENVLYDHPGVHEVAVIGVPDQRWGETVKAVVVAKPGSTVDAADLIEFARTRLARYKCPTSMDTIDALPRNASGKVLKTELRAPYRAGQDRKIS